MFNKTEYAKQWRRENPDKVKKQGQRRYKRYREKIIKRVKEYNLKTKYNLTPTELDKLLEQQDHRCAICGLEETRYLSWSAYAFLCGLHVLCVVGGWLIAIGEWAWGLFIWREKIKR